MRFTTPLRVLLVVVPVVLVLAGCGGGGAGGGSPSGTGVSTAGSAGGGPGEQTGAYQGGFEICSTGSVEEVAASYGVPETTPDAVADSIAEAVSGGTPAYATEAKQGCLDAFNKK